MKLSALPFLLISAGIAAAQTPFCPSGFQYPNAYCCARSKPFDPNNPRDGFYYNCYKRNHFGCFGRYAPWDVCCGRLRVIRPDETVTIPNVPKSKPAVNVAVRCTLGNKPPRKFRNKRDMDV